MNHITRRDALAGFAATALTSALGRVTFAAGAGDQRLVLIVLRGALDGLALAPPYADPHYANARGRLTIHNALKLDSLFGLHPSMSRVHEMFAQRQALVIQAVASPYRARSHFDGQDILETGSAGVDGTRSGWLNRALGVTGASAGAIALAHTVPLVLRGDATVSSYAPSRLPDADDDTLRRLADLYDDDAFFREQLSEALAAQAIAQRDASMEKKTAGGAAAAFRSVMEQTAKFLSAPDGPRIAVTATDGWDTHANQGADTGSLANKLKALDAGLGKLREGLGANWNNTAVLVVTEFGRTVRVNGTGGTDHGTGGAALVLGGAVRGGRVISDWPGLSSSALYQDRDLMPTLDVRSIFKTALVQHLGVDEARVTASVFPDSASAPVQTGWFRR